MGYVGSVLTQKLPFSGMQLTEGKYSNCWKGQTRFWYKINVAIRGLDKVLKMTGEDRTIEDPGLR